MSSSSTAAKDNNVSVDGGMSTYDGVYSSATQEQKAHGGNDSNGQTNSGESLSGTTESAMAAVESMPQSLASGEANGSQSEVGHTKPETTDSQAPGSSSSDAVATISSASEKHGSVGVNDTPLENAQSESASSSVAKTAPKGDDFSSSSLSVTTSSSHATTEPGASDSFALSTASATTATVSSTASMESIAPTVHQVSAVSTETTSLPSSTAEAARTTEATCSNTSHETVQVVASSSAVTCGEQSDSANTAVCSKNVSQTVPGGEKSDTSNTAVCTETLSQTVTSGGKSDAANTSVCTETVMNSSITSNATHSEGETAQNGGSGVTSEGTGTVVNTKDGERMEQQLANNAEVQADDSTELVAQSLGVTQSRLSERSIAHTVTVPTGEVTHSKTASSVTDSVSASLGGTVDAAFSTISGTTLPEQVPTTTDKTKTSAACVSETIDASMDDAPSHRLVATTNAIASTSTGTTVPSGPIGSATSSTHSSTVPTIMSQNETKGATLSLAPSATTSITAQSTSRSTDESSASAGYHTTASNASVTSQQPNASKDDKQRSKPRSDVHRIGSYGRAVLKHAMGNPETLQQFVEDCGPKVEAISDALTLFDVTGVSRVDVYKNTSAALIKELKDRLDMLDPKRLELLYSYTLKFSQASPVLYPLLAALVEKFPNQWEEDIKRKKLFGFPEMLPPDKRLKVWSSDPQLLSHFLNDVVEQYVNGTSQISHHFDLCPMTNDKSRSKPRAQENLNKIIDAIGENFDLYQLVCKWLILKYRSTQNPVFLMVRVDLYAALMEKEEKLAKRDKEATASTENRNTLQAVTKIVNQDPYAKLLKELISTVCARDTQNEPGGSRANAKIQNCACEVAECLKRYRNALAKAVNRRRQDVHDAVNARQSAPSAAAARKRVPKRWRGKKLCTLKEALTSCQERLEKEDQRMNEFTDPPWKKYPSIKNNYLQQISRPMYLKEMRQRIGSGEYKSLDDMETDVNLMVDNCRHFITFSNGDQKFIRMAEKMREAFAKERRKVEPLFEQYCRMMEEETGEHPLNQSSTADEGISIGTPEEEAAKDTQCEEFLSFQTAINLLSEPRFQICISRALYSRIFYCSEHSIPPSEDYQCIVLLSVAQRHSQKQWVLTMETQFRNNQPPPVLKEDWCASNNVEKARLLEATIASEAFLGLNSVLLNVEPSNHQKNQSYSDILQESLTYLSRSSHLGLCLALQVFHTSTGQKVPVDMRVKAVEIGVPVLTKPLLESLSTLDGLPSDLFSTLTDLSSKLQFETFEELSQQGLLNFKQCVNEQSSEPKCPIQCMDFCVLVTTVMDVIWCFSLKVAKRSQQLSGSNVGALEFGSKDRVMWILEDWFPRLMLVSRLLGSYKFAFSIPWRTVCLPLVHYSFGVLLSYLLKHKLLKDDEAGRLLHRALWTLGARKGRLVKLWNTSMFDDTRAVYDNICCNYLRDFDRSAHGLPPAYLHSAVMTPWGQELKYKTPGNESRRSLTSGTPRGLRTFSPMNDGTRNSASKRAPPMNDDQGSKKPRL
eukprot:gb/GECG01008060.1/.p1 GENE.gb/GECG01008060.1/~~gb/GECG01008060.1/.p1  ORF type:complete len:1524 (+),score=230.30 gb/GECG01008060.1/:1-4572(+)